MKKTYLWLLLAGVAAALFVAGMYFLNGADVKIDVTGSRVSAVTSGLVGYWKFDEGSGSVASDSSGNSYSGTIIGADWVEGISGYALEFNGLSDIVRTELEVDQSSSSNGATFTAWVLPYGPAPASNNFSRSQIVSTDNIGYDWSALIQDDEFAIFTGDDYKLGGTTSGFVYPNAWTHVAVVFDPSDETATLYLDGFEIVSGVLGYDDSVATVAIGENPSGSFNESFDGIIDEVKVYNRALSVSEISSVYNDLAGDVGDYDGGGTGDAECVEYLTNYQEFDHYGGYPGNCDCEGNCWALDGYWYADPDYTGDDATEGYPSSCDGLGTCWDNYGYSFADPFLEDDGADGDDGDDGDDAYDGGSYGDVNYTDVPVTHPDYPAINYVTNLGIFSGYPDGSFKPNSYINRAETAKVILEGFRYPIISPPAGTGDGGFYDLDASQWYMDYIYTAFYNYVLTGYPDGSMKPGNTVNRVEMLKMFLQAASVPLDACIYGMSMDVVATDWHCPYVMFALDSELMSLDTGADGYSFYFYPADSMTRGDVAWLFYNYNFYYMGAQ